MATRDQLVGVTIFFTVLNTITVTLRIYARTILTKGAFGWDDVMLIVTYVCLSRPCRCAWKCRQIDSSQQN